MRQEPTFLSKLFSNSLSQKILILDTNRYWVIQTYYLPKQTGGVLHVERNKKMKQEFRIKACLKELDNQHLTWCEKINEEQDFKFEHFLNGTLFEKYRL